MCLNIYSYHFFLIYLLHITELIKILFIALKCFQVIFKFSNYIKLFFFFLKQRHVFLLFEYHQQINPVKLTRSETPNH